MKEIKLTSRQLMLSPDHLAFELGLIETPEQMERSKIATYFLIGVFATITVGIMIYSIHQNQLKNKVKKGNL